MGDDNPSTTTCPYCGVHFLEGPSVCPHCGRQLTTTGGIPLIKSPLGGRAWAYEYGQTEFTEMLSYCLMQNIDALADSGFVFSTDHSGLAFPQPMEVFLNQKQDSETVPLPVQQWYPEFPDDLPDDLEAAWSIQTDFLNQQKALLPDSMSGLSTLIDQILALDQTTENYQARAAMIAQIGQMLSIPPESEEEEELPEDLAAAWLIQTETLNLLKDQFGDLGYLITQKMEALPSESSISNLVENFVEGGLELFGSWILAKLAGVMGGPVSAILLPLSVSAIKSLYSSYTSNKSKTETFTSLIVDLLNMSEITTDTYSQRATQISTLTNALSSISQEIFDTEQSNTVQVEAAMIAELRTMNEQLQILALSENVIVCPHTGRPIYTKSLPKPKEEEA